MNILDEMFRLLKRQQYVADSEGLGVYWLVMCARKTPEAALDVVRKAPHGTQSRVVAERVYETLVMCEKTNLFINNVKR